MALTVCAELVAEDNLFDFFHAKVETATRHRRAQVSQDTVYYLSQLLAEQGKSEDEPGEPRTLVEMRERASNSSFAESVTWWKRMGDSSLVALGFFRENLRRRSVSSEYYSEMGRGAYGTLARMLRSPGPDFSDVFGELSERFVECTEVIAEVRDETQQTHETDIVRLYEEWLLTNSPRVAERLRILGVVPVRFDGQS